MAANEQHPSHRDRVDIHVRADARQHDQRRQLHVGRLEAGAQGAEAVVPVLHGSWRGGDEEIGLQSVRARLYSAVRAFIEIVSCCTTWVDAHRLGCASGARRRICHRTAWSSCTGRAPARPRAPPGRGAGRGRRPPGSGGASLGVGGRRGAVGGVHSVRARGGGALLRASAAAVQRRRACCTYSRCMVHTAPHMALPRRQQGRPCSAVCTSTLARRRW
jgi:hypothetical protein